MGGFKLRRSGFPQNVSACWRRNYASDSVPPSLLLAALRALRMLPVVQRLGDAYGFSTKTFCPITRTGLTTFPPPPKSCVRWSSVDFYRTSAQYSYPTHRDGDIAVLSIYVSVSLTVRPTLTYYSVALKRLDPIIRLVSSAYNYF